MGSIRFTPTFQHTDWVDDSDRVAAETANGFNGRFRAIDSDLHQVSTVVSQVGASLDALTGAPRVAQQRLTVLPFFVPTTTGVAWTITPTAGAQGVVSTGVGGRGAASTNGNLDLVLPDHIALVSLRAIGQATSTSIAITLNRIPYNSSTPDPPLATVTGTGNPFDTTGTVDAARAAVDLNLFRYYISAVTTSNVTVQPVAIGILQITYHAS